MVDSRLIPPERPIVKAGTVIPQVSSGGVERTFTFDKPFPEKPCVVATPATSTSGTVSVVSVTKDSFTLALDVTTGSAFFSVNWIAVLP